ncbi:hypothetical protein DUI87_01013 [Hirundo rustica rustica]|uniref:ribonuclease H n=1 Tax=Hirundo rustica rustica TaxID=333673 RepID=A0A3M0LM73_HIRRU|nr:hypothetical protein DUI87_01013 [Hirundo rustica rustica]
MSKRKTSCESMLFQKGCRRKTSTSSGKLEQERKLSTRDNTGDGNDSNPDSTGGTNIREHQSGSLSRTICRIPSDPELLPPRAQWDLPTSKIICFMDENNAVIPTGVTGASWKRQDLLIIGKERSNILGLIIYPSIISADCNEELTVLAQPLHPPLTVPENTLIAKAIALPSHATEQVMPVLDQKISPCGEHVEIHATWVKQIGQDRPIIVCDLICGENMISIKGNGGNSLCLQSENALIASGPGGDSSYSSFYCAEAYHSMGKRHFGTMRYETRSGFLRGVTAALTTLKLTWKRDSPVWVDQKLSAIKNLVKELLQKGHIKPTNSPWNSPVFMICNKASGSWRLLQDLRKINEVIEELGPLQLGLPSLSVIPRDWPLVIIDLKDCFFNIPLHPEDAPRFAFSIPNINRQEPLQRYHWMVLPQGLKNFPTICQWFVA